MVIRRSISWDTWREIVQYVGISRTSLVMKCTSRTFRALVEDGLDHSLGDNAALRHCCRHGHLLEVERLLRDQRVTARLRRERAADSDTDYLFGHDHLEVASAVLNSRVVSVAPNDLISAIRAGASRVVKLILAYSRDMVVPRDAFRLASCKADVATIRVLASHLLGDGSAPSAPDVVGFYHEAVVAAVSSLDENQASYVVRAVMEMEGFRPHYSAYVHDRAKDPLYICLRRDTLEPFWAMWRPARSRACGMQRSGYELVSPVRLFWLAVQRGHHTVAAEMLDERWSIAYKEDLNYPPLLHLVRSRNRAMLDVLLSRRAFDYPLLLAGIEANDFPTASGAIRNITLTGHGSLLRADGDRPMRLALEKGRHALSRYLLHAIHCWERREVIDEFLERMAEHDSHREEETARTARAKCNRGAELTPRPTRWCQAATFGTRP